MPIIRVQKMEVKLRRPFAEISRPEFLKGLAKSPTFPWLKTEETVSSEELLPAIQSAAPVDGSEIVEWMQLAASEGALLDAVCGDYNRLGSLLLSTSSDPYVPGVRLGDLGVQSVTGTDVGNWGGVSVVTPRGKFSLPAGGKATGIFPDILAWAANTWCGYMQWLLSLLQWKDLASTPIDQRVRFAALKNIYTSNIQVAPQFFIVKSMLPPPAIMMTVGFTSNRAQKVGFQMRSTGDYTSVLGSDTLEIPAGESEINYFLLGFPFVEAFVAHFQPEDNSEIILDSLTVTPP